MRVCEEEECKGKIYILPQNVELRVRNTFTWRGQQTWLGDSNSVAHSAMKPMLKFEDWEPVCNICCDRLTGLSLKFVY